MSLPSSPVPSSFDEFEHQQDSFDRIVRHRQTLADEAARVAKEHPGARIVGLIFEKDAPEAAEFRRALGMADGGSQLDFVGVVPRQIVLGIVGLDGSEEFDAMRDDTNGDLRRLPILFVATTGFRWGRAEYRVDARSG